MYTGVTNTVYYMHAHNNSHCRHFRNILDVAAAVAAAAADSYSTGFILFHFAA